MPNLYTLSGPDSITVYWDLPAQPAERYDILLDGARRGSTGKTHFTLRGLAPIQVTRSRSARWERCRPGPRRKSAA